MPLELVASNYAMLVDIAGEITSYTTGMEFDAFQDVETRIGLPSKDENL